MYCLCAFSISYVVCDVRLSHPLPPPYPPLSLHPSIHLSMYTSHYSPPLPAMTTPLPPPSNASWYGCYESLQTSSGKTFTMNGTSKQPGLIPQAVYMCFDSVGQYRDREFLFRVSYLEIYNETVRGVLTKCCLSVCVTLFLCMCIPV